MTSSALETSSHISSCTIFVDFICEICSNQRANYSMPPSGRGELHVNTGSRMHTGCLNMSIGSNSYGLSAIDYTASDLTHRTWFVLVSLGRKNKTVGVCLHSNDTFNLADGIELSTVTLH